MDAMKGLKYALVLVLVTSALLLGWTTYLERRLNRKLENFSQAVAAAKTEDQAKQAIRSFFDTLNFDSKALEASADGSGCAWLCR